MVEETSNNAEPGRTSNFDRYAHAAKMQPQSSGSLRSNAGAEKGKEIAAKLNIHRVHGQLRGLDTTGRILQQIFFFEVYKCKKILQKETLFLKILLLFEYFIRERYFRIY